MRKIKINSTDLPGIDDLKKNPLIQEEILKSRTDSDRVHGVEALIKNQLIHSRPYLRAEPDPFDKLQAQGLTTDQIVRAIATSLLHNTDQIELTTITTVDRLTKPIYLAFYSLATAFALLLLLVTQGRRYFEKEIIFLLQFEPLLAFFGTLLAVTIFYLLKFLKKTFY